MILVGINIRADQQAQHASKRHILQWKVAIGLPLRQRRVRGEHVAMFPEISQNLEHIREFGVPPLQHSRCQLVGVGWFTL